MDGSIAEFVKSVKIDSCRVINTPQLIFLCGGPTASPASSIPIRSARDYFYRYISSKEPDLKKHIRLAEEINDWFDEDTFKDLLELEAYLADTSDLIVLFVESPGSIAELGAFAADDSLRPRTLAILNSSHNITRTFITDGPVRRIRKYDENLIRYYKWNDKKPGVRTNRDVFEDVSKELALYIHDRLTAAPKEQTLNLVSNGHTMLMIADLIEMVGILTATEIMECLSSWGYSGVDKKKLNKYFSLLEHLKLIKSEPYSTQIYYLSNTTSPFIRYGFTPAAINRDRTRIKSIIRSALLKSDPRRMRVYQRELKRLKGKGHP